MRILILSVLLSVLTSFTTVTLAALPSSKGLVIETTKEYKFLHLSKVIKTDSLKIEPRWQGEFNYSLQELDTILHIDPGNGEWGFNNKLLDSDKTPILHIDPGRKE
jgi:hypothetical protein